jgi:hypothetical protein
MLLFNMVCLTVASPTFRADVADMKFFHPKKVQWIGM